MGCLDKAGQFGGRNERNIPVIPAMYPLVASPLTAYNHDILLSDDIVQDGSQVLAQVGIRRLYWHDVSSSDCTGFLYLYERGGDYRGLSARRRREKASLGGLSASDRLRT